MGSLSGSYENCSKYLMLPLIALDFVIDTVAFTKVCVSSLLPVITFSRNVIDVSILSSYSHTKYTIF